MHINSVPERKLSEFVGQVNVRFRNPDAVKQNWDDGDVAFKGRFNLDTHKIIRIVQTAAATFITQIKPVLSNDGEQHVTFGDFIAQHLHKI